MSDSGGGHRTFAETIRNMIEERYEGVETEFVYTADIYKNSRVYHLFRRNWVDYFFNHCPKFILPLAQKISRYLVRYYFNVFTQQAARNLKPFWEKKKPMMVISVYPLINKIIYDSLQVYNPKIPFLTVIADYGEMHDEAWIVKQNQYYACSTDNLYNTLMKLDIPKEKVIKTTGFLIPRSFYKYEDAQKTVYRRELQLDEKLLTIIVVFGAYGSFDSLQVFRSLNKIKEQLQLIFITGKNRPIPRFFKNANTHHKLITLPFTNELEKYFSASDLLIGKPGPNVVSQAISQALPVIVNKNNFTMIQERYVADYIEKHKLGVTVKNFFYLHQLVENLLRTEELKKLQLNTVKQKNEAYKEIASFIETILSTSSDQ
jgi:1,2-diacylglycerol 3-beta-galactosyltransferase